MKTGIIVTGLPASGKTTIARKIAQGLEFSFLDKDDFLEDLYERHGVPTWEHRKQLSRQSDRDFREAAVSSGSAVLVSHWRPLGDSGESGTPTDWLADEFKTLVEVCCQCSPEEAFSRFTKRTRHPGHFDEQRDVEELKKRLVSWSGSYPLGIGTVVEVRTDGAIDMEAEVMKVRDALVR